MEDKQVVLINTINAYVGVDIPDLRLKRNWERKGAKKSIPMSVLREAFYYPDMEYLLRQGILYIEDLDVKIELGLEDESAREPNAELNVQVLKDDEMKRLLTVVPKYDFEARVKKLPKEQIQNLIDYAVRNEYTDFEKCRILKDLTEYDIIKAVQLNQEDKEDTKEE